MTQLLSHMHGLCIGVAGYQFYRPLVNTVHDASDISAALKDPSSVPHPTDQVTLLFGCPGDARQHHRGSRPAGCANDPDSDCLCLLRGARQTNRQRPTARRVSSTRRCAEDRQFRCVPELRHLGRRVRSQAQGHQSAETGGCARLLPRRRVGLLRDPEGNPFAAYRMTICRVWPPVRVAWSWQPLGAMETASDGSGRNGLLYGAPVSRTARWRWRQRCVHPHLRSLQLHPAAGGQRTPDPKPSLQSRTTRGLCGSDAAR